MKRLKFQSRRETDLRLGIDNIQAHKTEPVDDKKRTSMIAHVMRDFGVFLPRFGDKI